MPDTRIGFVGTGVMGLPMARNLLRAGFPVTAYNRTQSRAEPLAAEGATLAGSPREAAERSDVVITIVSDGPDVEQVILGANGVIDLIERLLGRAHKRVTVGTGEVNLEHATHRGTLHAWVDHLVPRRSHASIIGRRYLARNDRLRRRRHGCFRTSGETLEAAPHRRAEE